MIFSPNNAEVLNQDFEEFFAYGQSWDKGKQGAGPYTKYDKRWSVRHDWKDAIFWSLDEAISTKNRKMRRVASSRSTNEHTNTTFEEC